jgi:hypothetical protein
MAAWATADCDHEKYTAGPSISQSSNSQRRASGRWWQATAPSHKGHAVDDKPSGNRRHRRNGPRHSRSLQTQINRVAAVSLSAAPAVHPGSSDCPGCQAIRAAGPLCGPPGLPAGRQRVLPQPPVLAAATRYNHVSGPYRGTFSPTCGLTTRWDWMGTGWAAVLPSPCLQLPVRTASAHQHAACCRSFPLQRAWFGLGPSTPSSIPCRGTLQQVHCYKSTMPLYSPRRPSYTVYAPTSPYSRPHEPKHSPASFKSSTSNR